MKKINKANLILGFINIHIKETGINFIRFQCKYININKSSHFVYCNYNAILLFVILF